MYYCKILDKRTDVIQWASESLKVWYLSPKDGKLHRYYPDFIIEIINQHGHKERQVIEIKPFKETKSSLSRTPKTRVAENMTYAINQAKWKACQLICDDANYRFIILTERELFG